MNEKKKIKEKLSYFYLGLGFIFEVHFLQNLGKPLNSHQLAYSEGLYDSAPCPNHLVPREKGEKI